MASEVRILPSALMDIDTIRSTIQNEPLFERNICLRNLKAGIPQETKSLFVGVGLCTAREPASAVPFDILAFFLLPELLRREGIIDSTFFLIADTHALTNSFMTSDKVKRATALMRKTAFSIVHSLRLQNFHIVTATEIRNDKTIKKNLPTLDNKYVQEEVFDLCWFAQNKNVGWKLGWTISNEVIPRGHDERFFDTEIQKWIPKPFIFLHSSAGRTFDPRKPKTSPYIALAHQNRLLLTPDEKVTMKLEAAEDNSPNFMMVKNHLVRIVRLFEKLIIKIPTDIFAEKIEFICRAATQEIPAVV